MRPGPTILFFVRADTPSDLAKANSYPRAAGGRFGFGPADADRGGGALPKRSADIKALAEAEAYWREHFEKGNPRAIRCQYGKRIYGIHVTFARNHAYTEGGAGVKDERRTFDPARACGMDAIWQVLQNPQAVTWSDTKPGNKTFDRAVALSHTGHGRVVLEPAPTPEDIAAGRVTHFAFVSWHPIPRGRFKAAVETARNRHVSPTSVKKAIPGGMALFAPRTLNGEPRKSSPASEGFAFNWKPYFYGSHNRTPEGADGGTEPRPHDGGGATFFKAALPPGARWITVHPNGKDEKG